MATIVASATLTKASPVGVWTIADPRLRPAKWQAA
jgi:hypothetical protein